MNSSQINFTSLNVLSCFSSYYVVPFYQREYVWGEEQVETLLEDLYESYTKNKEKDYFLGTIVTYVKDNKFELIDGQQRLTTFFIILCAIKHLMAENGLDAKTVENLLNSPTMDIMGNESNKFHLELLYDEAFLGSVSYLNLIYEHKEMPTDISESGKRIFNAYNCIHNYLKEKVGDANELKAYVAFILFRTCFIRVETYDVADALKIFETINQRGIGLNPMDLLKNMIFSEVSPSDFRDLNTEWRKITRKLEVINEKPLRFLRYFLTANYDVSSEKNGILREDGIYNWLKENNVQCKYKENPFGFVKKMQVAVEAYSKYKNPPDKSYGNIHLQNIPQLAGKAYKLHLMLMLASYNMTLETQAKFKQILESIVYYSVIDHVSTNTIERLFASWCGKIRTIHTLDDLNTFISNTIIPTVNVWKSTNEESFMLLGYNSMQQYRVKFILAKLSAYIDAMRSGTSEVASVDSYINNKIEIEHIMPQTCPDTSAYDCTLEEYNSLLHRFGNLTLLEASLNHSIHNADFTIKKEAFAKSNFYLTRSLCGLEQHGTNNALTRTNEKLQSWSEWTKSSITERSHMLYKLSEEIWSITV